MRLLRSLLLMVLVRMITSNDSCVFCDWVNISLLFNNGSHNFKDAWSPKVQMVSTPLVKLHFASIMHYTYLIRVMNVSINWKTGKLSGIVSERDYVKKVALLDKTSKEIKVKEISTKGDNLITVSPNDTVDVCMQKMLGSDIRHLPLVDEKGDVVGIVSIKDLIKACLDEKEHTIESLASFAVGEGGHFVM